MQNITITTVYVHSMISIGISRYHIFKNLCILRELQIRTMLGYTNIIVDHLRLSLVKAIFNFPCPVIGQEARGA